MGRKNLIKPDQQKAGRTFAIISISGMAAVLIGALIGGTLQLWFWGLAIVLDVAAAAIGTRARRDETAALADPLQYLRFRAHLVATATLDTSCCVKFRSVQFSQRQGIYGAAAYAPTA